MFLFGVHESSHVAFFGTAVAVFVCGSMRCAVVLLCCCCCAVVVLCARSVCQLIYHMSKLPTHTPRFPHARGYYLAEPIGRRAPGSSEGAGRKGPCVFLYHVLPAIPTIICQLAFTMMSNLRTPCTSTSLPHMLNHGNRFVQQQSRGHLWYVSRLTSPARSATYRYDTRTRTLFLFPVAVSCCP